MISLSVVFAVVAALVVPCIPSAQALHVAMIPFPELGHLNPFIALLEGFDPEIDTVTMFVPHVAKIFCDDKVARRFSFVTCHQFSEIQQVNVTDDFMKQMTVKPILDGVAQLAEKQASFEDPIVDDLVQTFLRWGKDDPTQKPIDVAVIDFGMVNSGTTAADAAGLPVVLVWPMILQLPHVTSPRLPGLLAGVPLDMSWSQFAYNIVIQRALLFIGEFGQLKVNSMRAKYGLPALARSSYIDRRIILTPAVFGLDIPQQLCPNIIPVGNLLQALPESEKLPEDWLVWMKEQCPTGRIVYVSFGSIARLPVEWLQEIEEGLMALGTKYCVVWKLFETQVPLLKRFGNAPNQRLVKWFPSPRAMFRDNQCEVFVSHCGTTGAYENVHDVGGPVVGIPLFVDQPDTCMRMQDAGIARTLDKQSLTAAKITNAIVEMAGRRDEVRAIQRRLHVGAELLGGPKRARQAIELAKTVGVESLRCRVPDNWFQRYDWDVTLVLVAMGYAIVYACIGVFRLVVGALRKVGLLRSTPVKVKKD